MKVLTARLVSRSPSAKIPESHLLRSGDGCTLSPRPRSLCAHQPIPFLSHCTGAIKRLSDGTIKRERENGPMEEQLALLHDAMSRPAPPGGAIDISVSRMAGECTVTMRAQLGSATGGGPAPMPVGQRAPAPVPLASIGRQDSEPARPGIQRAYTTNSFYEEDGEVPNLLAEIERLKRKALSRGVVLTSKDEAVPAEDVVVLKQIFSIADDTGDGEINMEQLGQLHTVLGEPLNESELKLAFKAMDHNKSGTVSFDDFLSWYTLAHSSSGILSKKGSAYTTRFNKLMNKLSGAFDIKHLTTATTGEPNSLDFRVQFHYNDGGQLKQISPWHDIPLFSPDG